jgi:hypothetical protein
MATKRKHCLKEWMGDSGKISFQRHRRRSSNIIKNSPQSQFLLLSISEMRPRMSGRPLTHSKYAQQQVVVLFGKLLCQLGEARLTHTYQVVFTCLRTREYRLCSVAVLEHRRTTIRAVSRRVVARWGSVIFLYRGDGKWRRFNLGRFCVIVHEVES